MWITAIKPSVFILFSPILEAAADSLPGASAGNRPTPHFTDEETEAQRNGAGSSWSQAVLVVRQGLFPMDFRLYTLCSGIACS